METNSSIKVAEEANHVVVDVVAGGIGLKLYLTAAEASRLGQRIAEQARALVSRLDEDPFRHGSGSYQGMTNGCAAAD